MPALHRRLAELGLAGEALEAAIRSAVRVGNRDVDNFADNDAARFLDNTWKLLPESNPALHSPMVYTVRDYRIALLKMEGFLAWLPAERVFHSWNDEPRPEVHARRSRAPPATSSSPCATCAPSCTRSAWSRRSPRSPAATCRSTTSWAGSSSASRPEMKRIEQFLPSLPHARDLDPPLHRLLAEGRASESSFDTGPSPLGAFLHAAVGEREVMKGVEVAKKWWAGAGDAAAFLAEPAARPIAAIARAAANIIDTRRDRLFALAERLER